MWLVQDTARNQGLLSWLQIQTASSTTSHAPKHFLPHSAKGWEARACQVSLRMCQKGALSQCFQIVGHDTLTGHEIHFFPKKKKRKRWNAIISESIRCIQDKYCFMKVFQFFSGQNVKAIGVPKSENSCLSVSCSQGCSICSAAAPTS